MRKWKPRSVRQTKLDATVRSCDNQGVVCNLPWRVRSVGRAFHASALHPRQLPQARNAATMAPPGVIATARDLLMLLHKQLKLAENEPRLDLLVQKLTDVSRSELRGLFDHACVRLDGLVCPRPTASGRAGQTLDVTWEAGRRYKEKQKERQNRDFAVVFEDKYLIVVNKRAGVLTVPTDRGEDDTLVHAVARHFSRGERITHRAWIVHRLDRDTSGLLIFARTEAVAAAIKDQFEARKPEREYVAIVAGILRDPSGTMRSFLATNDDLDQYSTQTPGEGKLAITHYTVQERLRGATLVQVHLETGRRNQIRVHFSEAGHPVLGDPRYKPAQAAHAGWREKRLALHARTLGFRHPVTGDTLRFVAETPACFGQFVRAHRPADVREPPGASSAAPASANAPRRRGRQR